IRSSTLMVRARRRRASRTMWPMAARHPAQLLPVLLLILAALLPFLFLALFIVLVLIAVRQLAVIVFSQRLLNTGFVFGGLSGLAFALALVIFPGVEQQMQPRHHLLDRRQPAGWAGLAARTRFAPHAGLALWPCFATFALRSRLALRADLAARTFRPGSSGMALQSGPPRLARPAAGALRSRSSLSADCVVCHQRTPMSPNGILAESPSAAIARNRCADLININRDRSPSRRTSYPAKAGYPV